MRKILVFVLVLYIGRSLLGAPVLAVDYKLPHPGILPDSPIYFLKVVRDQVVLSLISDTRQKAFYLLLLSDKRLAAGEALTNKNSRTVGAMSVIKAEDYFSQAVDAAVAARKAGEDTKDLFSKLTVASERHTEVIGNLANKMAGKDAEQLTEARRDNQNSGGRVREVFFQIAGVTK